MLLEVTIFSVVTFNCDGGGGGGGGHSIVVKRIRADQICETNWY